MDLYKIPKSLATQKSNSLYVTGMAAQWANRADLKTFLKANRPDLNSSTTFRDLSINGGKNSQNRKQAGYEANLDVQYTVGIASGVPVTYLMIGPNTVFNGFTDFLLNETQYLLAQPKVPLVLSTSYGTDETGWSNQIVT
jgi:tripeptidyl-peptidase I